jgi:hypothetical protein
MHLCDPACGSRVLGKNQECQLQLEQLQKLEFLELIKKLSQQSALLLASSGEEVMLMSSANKSKKLQHS